MAFNLIKAEILKYKKTYFLPVILFPPLIVVMSRFNMFRLLSRSKLDADIVTWSWFLQYNRLYWAVFFYNIVTVILVAYTCFTENQNRNWKLLLTQPISRKEVFLTKLFFAFAGVSLTSIIFAGGVVIAAHQLKLSYPPLDIILLLCTPLTSLPIVAITLWLATRFRSFYIPMVIGVLGHIISLIVAQTPASYVFPWAYPLEILQIRPPNDNREWSFIIIATILGCLFSWMGYKDFSKREIY